MSKDKESTEPSGIDWRMVFVSLATALAAFIGGQISPSIVPVNVDPAPVVAVAPPEAWIPTDSAGKRIACVALESLASTLTDGSYLLTGVPKPCEPFQSRTVVLSTSGVVPPKPVPVVPLGPEPKPVSPVPVIGDKFTAMILEDRESNRDLSASQLAALQSAAMLAYLDAKTATDADGVHEWRKWDDSLTPDQISEDEPWKSRYAQAYKDSNGVRPWLYATNGKDAISIKFPDSESAVMAELKKLGGE